MKKIKKGDKVRIKDNLMDELVRLGFNREEMKGFVERFKGKVEEALDVYQDKGVVIDGEVISEGNLEWYVTVDLCCEIPLNACELATNNAIIEFDKYFKASAILLVEKHVPNTSLIQLIQRKFRIGYNRASRIIRQLEASGIVGKSKNTAKRYLLINEITSLEKHLSGFELGEQTMSDPAWDNRDWI
jgi:Ftsk gamma domain.